MPQTNRQPSEWHANKLITVQSIYFFFLLPTEPTLWDGSEWLVMTPYTFLKSIILSTLANLKSKCANSVLGSLRIRQLMFSIPTYYNCLKAPLKTCTCAFSSCLTMSVEETLSEGLTESPVLFHLDWGHVLWTGNHWLYLKDLGNKNPTGKNLSLEPLLCGIYQNADYKIRIHFLAF